MTARPVTIRDVARAAGVAVSTTSMALNGHPRINATTRVRVRTAAEALGYRRNPAFAALGSKAYMNPAATSGLPIAFVSETTSDGQLPGDMPGIILGASGRAQEMGYRVDAHCPTRYASPTALAKTLRARGYAGVIFGHIDHPEVLIAEDWSRFALVAAGVPTAPFPVHTVRINRSDSARAALRHIWNHGYRRIGFLCRRHAPTTSDEDFARYGGALAAYEELGVPRRGRIPPLIHGHLLPAETLSAWLVRYRPDAVLSTTCGDAYSRLLELGYRIPETVAFASLLGGWAGTAGLRHPHTDLGAVCVEWLDQLIRHGQFGFPPAPRAQVLEPRWTEGPSLPQRR